MLSASLKSEELFARMINWNSEKNNYTSIFPLLFWWRWKELSSVFYSFDRTLRQANGFIRINPEVDVTWPAKMWGSRTILLQSTVMTKWILLNVKANSVYWTLIFFFYWTPFWRALIFLIYILVFFIIISHFFSVITLYEIFHFMHL